jgi:hypothetical protein
VRSLLDNNKNVQAFYSHWRIQALIKPPGKIFMKARPPSYISSRTFALTLLDTFAPPDDKAHSDDLIARAEKALGPVDESHPNRPTEIVRGMLRDALNTARYDDDKFRETLERSFDEVMDRVSGWYKRRVQLILFVLAVGLAAVMNADSFLIGQRLWQDPALRSAVVAQATSAVNAKQTVCKTSPDAAATCVTEVKSLGLPLGWSEATSPHSFRSVLGKIIGLLVTAFALSLGAPFWFDLLGKVANLRGAGPAAPGAQAKTS